MPKSDRWLFWPTFISLAVAIVMAFICGLPGIGSFIMIPIALLFPFVAIITIGAFTAYLLMKQRPKRAVSFSVALILPLLLLPQINWVADCVHLGLTAGLGLGQLGRTSKPIGDGLEVFDWSVGLAGGPSTFLIRDPTDKIALPGIQLADSSDPSGFCVAVQATRATCLAITIRA